MYIDLYIFFRYLQLSESSDGIQTWILLLPIDNLCALMHVSHSVLGLILAGFQISASQSIFGSHNFINNVNPNSRSE